MEGKILSIDLGETRLSMALVTMDRSEQRLAATVEVPLAGRPMGDVLAEARAALAEQADISGAACVASVPDSDVFYRTVQLPFADRKKVEKVIGFELSPLLPVPLAEVMIDFSTGGGSPVEDGQTLVLAGAVLRSRLGEYLAHLRALSLDPEIVVPRGFAAADLLSQKTAAALLAVVEADSLFLASLDGSRVSYVRVATLPPEAETRWDRLGKQLRYTLLAYQEITGHDFSPEAVYLSGLTDAEHMPDTLEKSLGIPVRRLDVADLWQSLTGATLMGMLGASPAAAGAAANLAPALGLLRQTRRSGLNFRQGEFAASGKWRQYSGLLAPTAVLGLLVLVLGVSGYFYDLYQLQKQIHVLDARVVSVFQECCPHITEIVDPLPQLQAELKQLKEKSGMPEEIARSAYTIDILNDISRLIPDGIDLEVSRLVVGPEEVLVTGHTDAFTAVDAIKNRLGESPRFGPVEISSATMNKIDQRVHFKLRVVLL